MVNKVVKSSSLLILSRLIQRSIGLVSTLILARILIPEHFGIAAFLSITVHFFSTLALAGSQQYILSKPEVDDDDLNTSWTINFILSTILWFALVISVPFLTSYFDMEEAERSLYFLSFIILMQALFNPGVWLMKKNLYYGKFFILEVIAKVVSFVVAMAYVYFEPSYWALVYCDLARVGVMFLGSYIIHPFKPKLSFVKFKLQWAFTQWMFLKGGLSFLKQQVDTLLVAKVFNVHALGGYFVSKDVVSLPANQIITPGTEPLLAVFAKATPEQLIKQVYIAFIVITLMAFPLSLFIYNFAEVIVLVLLGEQWLQSVSIFSNLSFFMLALCYHSLLVNICIYKRRVRLVLVFDILSVFLLLAVIFLIDWSDIASFALGRGALEIVLSLILFVYSLKLVAGSLRKILWLTLPIIASSMVSVWGVKLLTTIFETHIFIELIVYSSVYFGIYFLTLLGFYRVKWCEFEEYKEIMIYLEKFIVVIQSKLSRRHNNAAE